MNITESIGYYSPYNTLEEVLAQFNTRGRQMICDMEPSEVMIRRYNTDGIPYLYQAKQVYVKVRNSPKGQWRKCELLTFGMERYGMRE